MAERAAYLAARSGLTGREEAFLAGLMHDVGKLVILNLPEPLLASHHRLKNNGCPGVVVEGVTLGESRGHWRSSLEGIAFCGKHRGKRGEPPYTGTKWFAAELHHLPCGASARSATPKATGGANWSSRR